MGEIPNTAEGTHYPRMREWLIERDGLRIKLQRRDALLRDILDEWDHVVRGRGLPRASMNIRARIESELKG